MTMVATETTLAGDDSLELINNAISAFDYADVTNVNFWRSGGQGWMSTLFGIDDPRYAYVDMGTYYDELKHLREGVPARTTISVMTDLGSVSIDSVLGIQPDPETAIKLTPEQAAAIVYGAIDRLTDDMPVAA